MKSARACTSAAASPASRRATSSPDAPRGDLLQAGPLLVRDGVPVYRREDDREGFRAGYAQFDSDITDGRYPRAALGLADGRSSRSPATGARAMTPGSRSRSWPR